MDEDGADDSAPAFVAAARKEDPDNADDEHDDAAGRNGDDAADIEGEAERPFQREVGEGGD